MKLWRSISARLAACAVLAYCLGATADNLTLDEFVGEQLSYLGRISSLEFETRHETVPSSEHPNPALHPRSTLVERYAMEGPKFLKEMGLPGTELPPELSRNGNFTTRAYDLEHYQIYDNNSGVLTRRDAALETSYGNPPAFLQPYRFLILGGRPHFEVVSNPDIWLERYDRIETLGPVMVNGHETQVFALHYRSPVPRGTALTRVFTLAERGHFPIRYQDVGESGEVFRESTVTEFEFVPTQNGSVLAPLRIEQTGSYDGKSLHVRELFEIDRDSLRINVDIPDHIFTIPVSTATRLEYNDNP